MSPRIDPKETSITPSSPDPLTNCSNSSESGLAGLDRSGPTSLVSASIKKMTPSCQCESKASGKFKNVNDMHPSF